MLKRFVINSLIIMVVCMAIFPFLSCNSQSSKFTLEKKVGHDFKILQLTDVQIIDPLSQPYEGRLGEDAVSKWADKNNCAFNLIRELVDNTNPDYIVLTGDNVYGQFDKYGNSFISLVQLMESFKIPWSFVNGNHDGEYEIKDQKGNYVVCGKGMQWQGEYIGKHTKYCIYEMGDDEMGYGNYTVKLLENKKTIFSFSFFDTHGCVGYCGQSINQTQREWFESELNKINEESGNKVPNFIFLHIPLYEYSLAMRSLGFDSDIGAVSEDGYPNQDGNFGKNGEKINYFNSSAFWDKIKELDCTKGIFAGHDHVNNTSIMYEGIRLTFGTKTGIYDYCDQQGGNLITIKDDCSFSVEPIYQE